jgi:hypothetical protein
MFNGHGESKKMKLIKNPFPDFIQKIIVDGANIAFYSRNSENKAEFMNLQILDDYLKEIKNQFSIDYLIVCDSTLQYRISNKNQYKSWCNQGKICQSPATIKADEFITSLMTKFDGNLAVISNDLFKEYKQLTKLLYRIQYGFMIIFEEIILKQFIFSNSQRIPAKIRVNALLSNINSEE